MTVQQLEGGKQPCSVGVVVVGVGYEVGVLNPSDADAVAWVPENEVMYARLGEAIEASIRATGMFRDVVPKEAAERVLEVVVHRFWQKGGFDMSVDITAMWTLRDRDGKRLSETAITGHGEAAFGEAIWGSTRLRLCLERAGHALIEKGLTAIAPP